MTSFGLATAMALAVATPLASDAPPPAPDASVEDAPELEWSEEGFYLMTGVAPGSGFGPRGFNPMIRYSVQLGMRWERKDTRLSVGAEGWVLQVLEAKGVGGGVHGVVSLSGDHAYARAGLGVVAGIPGSHNDRDSRSALSALAGIGLEGGDFDEVRGRIGVDYNLSVDKEGRVNNAVFLVLRIRFG